jgi:hypothetical protein
MTRKVSVVHVRHGVGPTRNVALVKDGVVVNMVKVPADWTGKASEWQPPENYAAIDSEHVMIGDTYTEAKGFRRKVLWNDLNGDGVPDFEIDPENPPEEVFPVAKVRAAPTPTLEEKLARVGLTLVELKTALSSK